MDGGLHVALVLDVDDDLRALLDFENRPGDRAVVGQHPHDAVADALGHGPDAEVELIAV